ncbi:hypothetical protein F7725_006902 [Dissostichus mawsoni]|uniref:Actin filament-associated protein 1-like 1 n=1 Tax=Dissostichus mawsoni TaxID=36200 RepID=A0A7J5XV76_DISMA|nr:hypothetical protein F7725_006902 [Dissostichus mawsoni]
MEERVKIRKEWKDTSVDKLRQETTAAVVMERLVSELGSLLKMLDHETVSSATAEKMASVRNIMESMPLPVNGSDVYMNSCLYGNGTSFVESLFDGFDCDLHMLSASPVEQKEPKEQKEEEEKPLIDPDKSDAYYEDADNNYPITRINGPPKNSYNDSDALSSSYESYEEDEDEAKGREQAQRWTAEESTEGPVRDCRICAFLLRKKRFGQWTKQLIVVRDNKLQEGRKKRHELRFSLPGGEALVLAVQSKEQAQRWLKVLQCERQASDSDSGPIAEQQLTAHGAGRDSIDSLNRGKRGPFSELTGSMSRAAGKKINRIITFSKKKPPLPGDPPSFIVHHDNPRSGFLSVCLSGSWKELWCVVRGGNLYLQKDPGDQRPAVIVVPLKGAEVLTGSLGPKHPFSFCILQAGIELASMEQEDVDSRIVNVRRHASFSSRDSDKTEQQAAVKRHASNVNHYARYGKTRAEEDARRYLTQKEELEKQKEELRNELVALRREKKEMKEEMKSVTGQAVEQRLAKLDALCKQREEERVELELKLTEVKENLRKSLARGSMSPPTTPKMTPKAQGNRVEKVYIESVPINAATELRKRPATVYASSRGNVMQKAKEWESKKGT